jgi:hypothetical protein
MIPRVKPQPAAVAVVFERDGEEPVRAEAIHGKEALARAVGLLLRHTKLHVGDRLTVEAID